MKHEFWLLAGGVFCIAFLATAALFGGSPWTTAERIVTTCVFPPIPIRDFDWCAHRESYEPPDVNGEGDWPCGWGRTEAEAIADLLEREGEG